MLCELPAYQQALGGGNDGSRYESPGGGVNLQRKDIIWTSPRKPCFPVSGSTWHLPSSVLLGVGGAEFKHMLPSFLWLANTHHPRYSRVQPLELLCLFSLQDHLPFSVWDVSMTPLNPSQPLWAPLHHRVEGPVFLTLWGCCCWSWAALGQG